MNRHPFDEKEGRAMYPGENSNQVIGGGTGGVAWGSGGVGGGVATRQPLVTEQLNGTAKRVDQMSVLIGALEDRISTITVPVPPTPETAANRVDRLRPAVQLAHVLLELNDRLDALCMRLDSLHQRIEL